MESFLQVIRDLARVLVGFAVVISFVAGVSDLERGGGALAGGALIAASIFITFGWSRSKG